MLQKVKQYWRQGLAVLGVILGYIFLKKYFQGDLLAQLLNANTKAKDDVLNERKEHVKRAREDEQAHNDDLRKELNKPAPDMTPKEIEDFYKNRK